MVKTSFSPDFRKKLEKITDKSFKERIVKQIIKITSNPEIGKPMRHARKNTRDVYISPYRLSYAYSDNKIIILDIYHKDEQ